MLRRAFPLLLCLSFVTAPTIAVAQMIAPQADANSESVLLGDTFFNQGRFSEAIDAYRRALQINPNDASTYEHLGQALYRQANLGEAIDSFRHAIDLDPNNADAYNGLGYALSAQGKLDDAIDNFRHAIRLNPDNADAYGGLGAALYNQENFSEAIDNFRRALYLEPNNARFQGHLRQAQEALALQDERVPEPVSDERLLPVLRSTARVIVTGADSSSYGAGWVVKRQDNTVWVVTNRHVLSDRQTNQLVGRIEVEFGSDSSDDTHSHPSYPATLVQVTEPDQEPDLAVLQVIGVPDDVRPLQILRNPVPRDTNVWVIGHPISVGFWVTTRGSVVAYTPDKGKFSVDAIVAQGNSGGPVVNQQMQVIGMIVANRTPDGINVDPNQPTPSIEDFSGTRGVGVAYSVEQVIRQLRSWNILE